MNLRRILATSLIGAATLGLGACTAASAPDGTGPESEIILDGPATGAFPESQVPEPGVDVDQPVILDGPATGAFPESQVPEPGVDVDQPVILDGPATEAFPG